MVSGVSASTGKALDGRAHLIQSIGDILGTPIGSRVMRRDYGSRIPDLVDRPVSPELVVDITIEAATALDRWEPRVRLDRVYLQEVSAGNVVMSLDLIDLDNDGQPLKLEGIEI